MTGMIGLDFETYGSVNLPVHGLDRYTEDPLFTPLIAQVAERDNITVAFDFVRADKRTQVARLERLIGDNLIVAHNAPFEERCLAKLGLYYPSSRFIDSAVVSRAAGAGSSLEAAAPQLLGTLKLASGWDLIKLFSIPGKYQEKAGNLAFDPQIVWDHPKEWDEFGVYCALDAELSLRIASDYLSYLTSRELEYSRITMDMNRRGWPVDLAKVEEMQRRYLENQAAALESFRMQHDAAELNLNSLKQLKEWCADRGVKATSFNEAHVAKLIPRLDKKLCEDTLDKAKREGYEAVHALLVTKQVLGGSSLKKLQVILDTVSTDYSRPTQVRLRDQYLHCGAGQTWRTTGRSVQMQNLKRLAEPADMDSLDDPSVDWSNTELASNIRQTFTSSDPNGVLIVGDFSSVESRGLAWLAGAKWKLDAFRSGLDMYKVLAEKIYGTPYDDITKLQRQTGKVGELSCGYGAGAGAVVSFAEGMGVAMTEGEASKLVSDWRLANPEVVVFWSDLDLMLHEVLERGMPRTNLKLADEFSLTITRIPTPNTLVNQHPGARSIAVMIKSQFGEPFMVRYFHGCYLRGRNIAYYKPSKTKGGELWSGHYVDPKTKQTRFYEIYGGKLAGIITQSFCRELFMQCLAEVDKWCNGSQLQLIGQFHDEIVLDLVPGALSLEHAKHVLGKLMSDPGMATSFPLAADIKHDYRYTK